MLTVPQAAARLGIAETTLRVHCRQGRVPGAQFIGGIWLLPDPPEVDRPKMGRPVSGAQHAFQQRIEMGGEA